MEAEALMNLNTLFDLKPRSRAVPRIFCLWGQTPSAGANSTNLHRDLPYTDRVSSQTLC